MKSNKVGILTLPLLSNIGGILQAYALSMILKENGIDSKVINIKMRRSFIHKIISLFIYSNYIKFIKKYIPKTKSVKIYKDMTYINKLFDTIIVGSDQVWRHECAKEYLYHYLLDFFKGKKISYAASFGIDNWEPGCYNVEIIKSLAKEFNLITVREDSGITICNHFFERESTLVLDPTLLLKKESYLKLTKYNKMRNKDFIAIYIFDDNKNKQEIVKEAKDVMKMPIKYIGRRKKISSFSLKDIFNIKKYAFKPIEEWLENIYSCNLFITDSFHGVAFSIIFNKQFIVIVNKKRGATRFYSLLNMLNLNSRIVEKRDEVKRLLIENNSIDFEIINPKLEKLRKESITILLDSIKN